MIQALETVENQPNSPQTFIVVEPSDLITETQEVFSDQTQLISISEVSSIDKQNIHLESYNAEKGKNQLELAYISTVPVSQDQAKEVEEFLVDTTSEPVTENNTDETV